MSIRERGRKRNKACVGDFEILSTTHLELLCLHIVLFDSKLVYFSNHMIWCSRIYIPTQIIYSIMTSYVRLCSIPNTKIRHRVIGCTKINSNCLGQLSNRQHLMWKWLGIRHNNIGIMVTRWSSLWGLILRVKGC